MNIFTYGDYIRSIHTVRLHAIMNVMEESAKYNQRINSKEIEDNIIYDKFIKELLKNKREVVHILNDNNFKNMIDTNKRKEKFQEDDLIFLEKSNRKRKLEIKEADSIFRLKNSNREVYIVFEYVRQDKISVKYRMLNYCIEIMQKWIRSEKKYTGEQLQNIRTYPIIIPIVVVKNSELKIDNNQYYINQNKEEEVIKYNTININQYLNKNYKLN